MSWGFFADLRLALPTSAWERIRKLKPNDVALPKQWSGLDDAELESGFSRATRDGETFGDVLAWKWGANTIARVDEEGDATTIRVCALLDRSQLDCAFPLAALLHAACEVASGSLRLVNDGTFSGEDGTVLTLARGKIKTEKVDDCWAIVDELGPELFEVPAKPGGKPRINPFTGLPVELPAKKIKTKKR